MRRFPAEGTFVSRFGAVGAFFSERGRFSSRNDDLKCPLSAPKKSAVTGRMPFVPQQSARKGDAVPKLSHGDSAVRATGGRSFDHGPVF